MIKKQNKGFTLIEILIVVAIIAILASIVLVGLGPTQSLGRDARRLSDLHEVQNGLELYYNKNGQYPVLVSGGAWSTLGTALTGANVGVSAVPSDPQSSKSYGYAWNTGGSNYELQATLENASGSEWTGYAAPANFTSAGYVGTRVDCANPDYCVSL